MDATKYKPYPAYKDSGVEWLGEVPEHWKCVKIKHTTYLKGRIGWHGLKSDEFFDEGIHLITGTDFEGRAIDWDRCYRISEQRYAEDPYIHLKENDLLITKDGSIGKLARVTNLPERASLNNGIFLVRPIQNSYSTDFLYWVLSSTSFFYFVDLSSNGTTINHLYQNVFENFEFPLPERVEQHAIAAFLDRETAKIDTLIAKQERLIELLGEKRNALISHAVTKGLNPDAPMKDSGVEWLGEVPEHWGMKRLKHISPKITVGIVVEPSKYYVDDGVPALRSLNIQPSKIVLENIVYISSDANELLLKSRLSAGDLVAVRSGQPGTTAVVPDDMDGINCIDLIIIRKPVHMSEKYLCWFMNSDGAQHQFVEGSGGAIQQHFNIGMAMNLISPYPPTQEQSHIVAFLDRETAKIDTLIAKARRAIDLLKERRTALISAAVTGKIDVREIVQSDDEKPLSRKRERGGGEGA